MWRKHGFHPSSLFVFLLLIICVLVPNTVIAQDAASNREAHTGCNQSQETGKHESATIGLFRHEYLHCLS